MNWDSFKGKFHASWHRKIKPFIESKECDAIYSFLKEESANGEKICPSSINTFKAFMVSLDDIKCVIVGTAPYDNIVNGSPIATGLYLDNSILEKPTVELLNFYKGVENELLNGLSLHYINTYSMDYLVKQGVLLLNAPLTTSFMKEDSHRKVWKSFISYLLKNIFNVGTPVLLIGEYANTFKDLVNKEYVFSLEDTKGIGKIWETRKTFQKIDNIIEENDKDSIMWLNIDVPF